MKNTPNTEYLPRDNRPRMLTINATARTGIISETALRVLVKQNKVPCIYIGTRFYVNYDRFCDWLNDPENLTAMKE